MHSWVVPLLPWLERAEVARQWDLDKPLTDPKNKTLAQIHLDVLVCPDDITVVGVRRSIAAFRSPSTAHRRRPLCRSRQPRRPKTRAITKRRLTHSPRWCQLALNTLRSRASQNDELPFFGRAIG